jgi:threonine/homoserine efflux transporter RhtA
MQLSTKTQGLSIVGLTLVVIAIVYAGAPSASNPETLSDHIGYMLRVTARLSFGALLLAYVARPLVLSSSRSARWLGQAAADTASLYWVGCCCQSHRSLRLCRSLFDHVW